MSLKTCPICGIVFIPNKHVKNTKVYCSYCRAVVHRKQCRDNIQRKRRVYGYGSKGNAIRHGTSELSDLSIITVNGQERVKGMVTLERLINKMKGDKSSLYESEHF